MGSRSVRPSRDETTINVISIAKAYRQQRDVELANITLYDSQILQAANRVEFQEQALKAEGHLTHYQVRLIAPDGVVQKQSWSEDRPVFFLCPSFIPLTTDDMEQGRAESNNALLRLILNTDVLWEALADIRADKLRAQGADDPSIAEESEILKEISREAKK